MDYVLKNTDKITVLYWPIVHFEKQSVCMYVPLFKYYSKKI